MEVGPAQRRRFTAAAPRLLVAGARPMGGDRGGGHHRLCRLDAAADSIPRSAQAPADGRNRRPRPPAAHHARRDERHRRADQGAAALPAAGGPPRLRRAFGALEDRRFYSHFGVDPIGLLRAIAANVLRRGVSQGGSTITQQLAKNLFLTQERTLWRKMQELVLALWLERKFSKTQIIELYLNRVYFGSGAYGVEAGAQRYFGKSARTVKVAEAAMLAGLVKSPSRLAPSRNPNGAERRAQAVLTAMTELGFVTETMAKTALAQP